MASDGTFRGDWRRWKRIQAHKGWLKPPRFKTVPARGWARHMRQRKAAARKEGFTLNFTLGPDNIGRTHLQCIHVSKVF